MPRPALLDVNVLVALFDPDHVHHEIAHDWFADHRHLGWATCPVTERGFARVLSNPAYAGAVSRVTEIVDRLRSFCAADEHRFWGGGLSLRDSVCFDLALLSGHRQLTDVYLLAVAHRQGGCLATFDRGVPWRAVVGATPDTLVVIAP